MLSETKLSLLQKLVQNASNEEIIWTKGYLAGLLHGNKTTSQPQAPLAATALKPTIIYGTETGNSKKIASALVADFKKNQIQAKAVDVFQYDADRLEKETLVLFVISTQGEGEFPQNALAFYEKLLISNTGLGHLAFAVLGLGDSSYPLFCNAGILLDEALEKRGAKRLLPLTKSDVDFAETVTRWEKDLQAVFFKQQPVPAGMAATEATAAPPHKKFHTGKITHKVILNDSGSNKETYHIEIVAENEIIYKPGDALGIIPRNKPALITKIASYFNENIEKKITIKNKTASIKEWLSERDISGLSKRSLTQIAALLQTEIGHDKTDLEEVLAGNSIPAGVDIASLIELLLPIAPRLYSIASSVEAHNGELHLTVNLNKFKSGANIRSGLASQYLADFPLHEPIDFYIHKNQYFRLPPQEENIIMIGPGTGIAPFRSFISYRDATGAAGHNWLFFGEQHFVQDFYYQTEIQDWITSGVLHKLDVAFSRDQEEKIYVQHRIRENAKEFNKWIENGATVYVCGQKNPMSEDVEKAIIEVIASERNISLENAREVLEMLENKGKYQKDVY